jgi:hypothetical protein
VSIRAVANGTGTVAALWMLMTGPPGRGVPIMALNNQRFISRRCSIDEPASLSNQAQ